MKQVNEMTELELLKSQREVYQNLIQSQQNLLIINQEIERREKLTEKKDDKK